MCGAGLGGGLRAPNGSVETVGWPGRGSRLKWGKNESQNFNGCPILSLAIGQEKLRTVFVFALAHLEGPPQAFAGYNSKFK